MPKNRWIDGAVFSRQALLALMITFAFVFCATAKADAQTRTLNLYNIHTKERAQITFKRGNRYDQDGLAQLNRFMRDWRRNESIKMDPILMDLLWEVYQHVGGREPIHIVSGYRSPRTNSALRSRSSGVANSSQHTRGKAVDFYIPGVKLSTLRAAGLKMEGGGVGYYPSSGAPFVHLDTGNVRHWPRMRRNDLMAVFPNGNTIHVPTDGKPLSGYQQAMAAYKSRQGSGTFAVASAGGSGGGSGGGGLLAAIFRGGSGDQNAPVPDRAPARAPSPTPQAPTAAPAPQAAETIIASLPARSVPVPLAAPRPQAEVGTPPVAPTVASAAMEDGFDASAAAAQAESMTATEVALNAPLPTRRPDYTPTPAAEADALVASIKTPEDGVPIAALLAERPSRTGSDAISDLLREEAQVAQAGVVVTADTSSMEPAVGEGNAGGEVFALAALPTTPKAASLNLDMNPLGNSPDVRETANAIKKRQVAALESSPRAALMARTEGVSPMMAIESGVRTTTKLGKPTSMDVGQARRSRAVDASPEVARWALEPGRVEQVSNGTTAPSFAYNVVRTPPTVIYNVGFQQQDAQPDPSRFSGKAVQFISLARFD